MSRSPDDLELEARRFAAYLVDQEPPAALTARYRRANELLIPDEPSAEDKAVLDLVRRRPSLLPLLDGASGVVQPDSMLRRKLLLMLALLETTPEFAGWFESPARGVFRTIASLIGQGALGALQVAAGLLIWPFIFVRARFSRVR